MLIVECTDTLQIDMYKGEPVTVNPLTPVVNALDLFFNDLTSNEVDFQKH
jgi:hypothetical protein